MNSSDLQKLPIYDVVTIYLFRKLSENYDANSLPDRLYFKSEDVKEAANQAFSDGIIKKAVANPPDIKYTYDARKNLPGEIEQIFPMTWLQDGKGKYYFRRTKRKNIIDISAMSLLHIPEEVVDQTPPFIASLLGKDEQAMFTRVRSSHLLMIVLGFPAWPIQGHHRTTVTSGQIEIDEVQAGLDQGAATIVPISAKGGSDKLSWSQALNLNTYGHEKAPKKGMAVRSLGLWRDSENTVWIVEFTAELEIDDIKIKNVRRFKFR